MKNLLVIADIGSSTVDTYNFLNRAIGTEKLPEGVLRLAANSWLIDVRKSLPFFASLVNTAQKEGVPLVVLPTDDEVIVLSPHR